VTFAFPPQRGMLLAIIISVIITARVDVRGIETVGLLDIKICFVTRGLYPLKFLHHRILRARRVILLLLIASVKISILYILLIIQHLIKTGI